MFRWLSKTSTTVTIETWANNMNFFGHFQLIEPEGTGHNSGSDQVWHAGGAGHNFSVELESGNYTAIAWQNVSPGVWNNIGQVQFTV